MSDAFGGWDELEVPDAGGKFFKFPVGQVVRFVLVGKPKIVVADFGQGPKHRVRSNIVDLANPADVKLVELSAKQAQTIKSIYEMSDSGQATVISCKRVGEGLKTEYTFVAGKALTDEQKAKLGKLELLPLEDDAPAAASETADDEEPI
jgi:hypothetical protein